MQTLMTYDASDISSTYPVDHTDNQDLSCSIVPPLLDQFSSRRTKEPRTLHDPLVPVRKIPAHNLWILGAANDPAGIKLQFENSGVRLGDVLGSWRLRERSRAVNLRWMMGGCGNLCGRCCCGCSGGCGGGGWCRLLRILRGRRVQGVACRSDEVGEVLLLECLDVLGRLSKGRLLVGALRRRGRSVGGLRG